MTPFDYCIRLPKIHHLCLLTQSEINLLSLSLKHSTANQKSWRYDREPPLPPILKLAHPRPLWVCNLKRELNYDIHRTGFWFFSACIF
jgi:hypothetical protein